MPTGGALTINTNIFKEHLNIDITDTGLGIREEDLSQIFDPFFTVKDEGTGLGLSISKSIIEQHNGTIKVQSETNKGTKFIISLPLN